MNLIFSEGGELIGEVRLVGRDELHGPPSCVSVVRNRMQRNAMTASEALKSLDGWSNGYLTTNLAWAEAE